MSEPQSKPFTVPPLARHEVRLWTDGSGLATGGPGGWAALLQTVDGNGEIREREVSGAEPEATNNRMEMLAVIGGLSAIERPTRVQVISDSEYVINPPSKGWLDTWAQNDWELRTVPDNLKGIDAVGCPVCGAYSESTDPVGCLRHTPAQWMTKGGFQARKVRNRDLWKRLAALIETHAVTFHWVPGHAGVIENERCDVLAGQERMRMRDDVFDGRQKRPMLPMGDLTPPEIGDPVEVMWGGGFRYTPGILLAENQVGTYREGAKVRWTLPLGAVIYRRPCKLSYDMHKWAEKEMAA